MATDFSEDGRFLVTLDGKGELRIWFAEDEEPRKIIKVPRPLGQNATALAISPDGRFVVAGNRALNVYDVKTGKLKGRLTGHSAQVHAIAFASDGASLATASQDKTVRIWKFRGCRETARITHPYAVHGVIFAPSQDAVITACNGLGKIPRPLGGLQIVALDNYAVTSLDPFGIDVPNWWKPALSEDGKVLALLHV